MITPEVLKAFGDHLEKNAYTLIEPIMAGALSGIIGTGAGFIHGKLSDKEVNKNVKKAVAASSIIPPASLLTLSKFNDKLMRGKLSPSKTKLYNAAYRALPVSSVAAGGGLGYLLGRKLAGKPKPKVDLNKAAEDLSKTTSSSNVVQMGKKVKN